MLAFQSWFVNVFLKCFSFFPAAENLGVTHCNRVIKLLIDLSSFFFPCSREHLRHWRPEDQDNGLRFCQGWYPGARLPGMDVRVHGPRDVPRLPPESLPQRLQERDGGLLSDRQGGRVCVRPGSAVHAGEDTHTGEVYHQRGRLLYQHGECWQTEAQHHHRCTLSRRKCYKKRFFLNSLFMCFRGALLTFYA